MKKLIYLTIIFALLAVISAIVICVRFKNGPTNINTNSASPIDSADFEYVEYSESYGEICPLGIKFLGKRTANTIECVCPEGYEFDHRIIGYEQCYGPGTECPIMGSECVKK